MWLLPGVCILAYAAPAAASSGPFAPVGEMLTNFARSVANELGLPVCILGVLVALLSAIVGLGSPAKATMVAFLGLLTVYAEEIVGSFWRH